MYQGLVDKELAVDVFSYLPMSFDPNLFYLMAVATPGVKAADLETALIAVINNVAKQGVTQAELEKAKNQKLMQFYREMETINGKADIIGTYELYFGSYQKLFEAPKNYQQVTPADIQRVAQQYLKKSNRTVAVLDSAEDKDL